MTTIAVRAPRSGDAEAVARLLTRVASGPTETVEELRVSIGTEESWLLEDDEQALGYLTLRLRDAAVADAELACVPGQEALLAELAEQRARELGAALLRIVPLDAGDTLVPLGYREARTFLRLGAGLPDTAIPEGVEPIAVSAPELHALEQEAFADSWGFARESYEEWRARTGRRFHGGLALLAREGGEPAGSIRCIERYGRAWITTLVVAPARQRRGHGGRLLEGALAGLRSAGHERVGLEVDERNEPARRLYARYGFEELTRERFFEKALQ